jgi:hypothetical protein
LATRLYHRIPATGLGGEGVDRAAAPVEASAGKNLLRVGPQHRTVWYEVEVQ